VSLIPDSEALHARVRAVAAAGRPIAPGDFDALALDIARFQLEHAPGFRRLVDAHGGPEKLVTAADIPAVPVDAFRLARVATHPPELDRARFETSGTTGAASGVHVMRTTDTYRLLSVAWGKRALISAWSGPCVVVALAPVPSAAPTSSLGFMMRAFMEEFDGRPLHGSPAPTSASPVGATPFDAHARERWLAGPSGIDVAGLRRAADAARDRDESLLVLATGFSLVLLLEALAGGTIAAPARTVVMPTGGFKGRTREVAPTDLARDVAHAFGIPETQVIGEYGMTELSSQLYEGTLPGGALDAPRGVFLPPPWLHVTALDATTLAPVSPGEIGIARFVDLGNVDSAVAILTQDLVRQSGAGIELHGRRPGEPARGCSLAIEQMVLGAREP
jgi:hypothetical protein